MTTRCNTAIYCDFCGKACDFKVVIARFVIAIARVTMLTCRRLVITPTPQASPQKMAICSKQNPNRTIIIAESLARVIVAIAESIARVIAASEISNPHWQSYLLPFPPGNEIAPHRLCVRYLALRVARLACVGAAFIIPPGHSVAECMAFVS